MKQILITTILFFNVIFCFGQSDNDGPVGVHFIEGRYGFTFDQETRIIQLSTSDEIYIEYDQNGNELGRGRLMYKSNDFYLKPIHVDTYSIINGDVSFRVEEWSDDHLEVRVFLDDLNNIELNLIKL